MKYQIYFPLKKLISINMLSERALSLYARVSRACLRSIVSSDRNITIESISQIANYFDRQIEIVVSHASALSEFSTVATAYKVERDGFDSWKVHFMDLVDQFRRSLDARLVLLPPHSKFDKRLTALMASLVSFICKEIGMTAPYWARKRYFLDSPWFVSGIESLKASALLESPLPFRNNNIFVHENFASRA